VVVRRFNAQGWAFITPAPAFPHAKLARTLLLPMP
jgi:hypothetical protein